ncbi:MAG: glycoside hydrolase family 2 protein [Acidimicrobiales bacterium]
MDLGGKWAAAPASEDLRRVFPQPDFDDSGWQPVSVPGHWQAEPGFANSDGPVLYRRRFSTEPLGQGQRAWLVLEGIFYQADVWLDGSYLGDTEGYFFPHSFDVSEALRARSDHVLAVEVSCERPAKLSAKRALMGVFGHWDCIDPAFNPGGIWAPVHLLRTGPVRISSLRVTCPEANAKRGTLDIFATLDAKGPTTALVLSELGLSGQGNPRVLAERSQPLAAGANYVRWQVEVQAPKLWWPASIGPQALYDLQVAVLVDDLRSDAKTLRTGFRHVRMHDYVWQVNGERLFLKGANLAPTRRDIAYASPEDVAADVRLARQAGLDLLRVHAHIARQELYDAADELGVLIWQDLPLQWSYRGARRQAVRQAKAAVDLLGHHPCIVTWCGHNEPLAVVPRPGGKTSALDFVRFAATQVLPTWNKSVLDRSVRRALERADPNLPVIAHSGIIPHPAWGTDSHLYFGWYYGTADDLGPWLAAWPALARFVSELGAQAVPRTNAFMGPGSWPDLDWDNLEKHHCLQKRLLARHAPPTEYDSFEDWASATQEYQAELVRRQVEALRRLKYKPTGGFAVFCLNDAQPAVSWALLDHERRPKPAYTALAQACSPVLVTADPLMPYYQPGSALSADLHVVNDLRSPLGDAVLVATLSWPGGGRRWTFAAPEEVPKDSCAWVGHLHAVLPRDLSAGAAITLDLQLQWQQPKGQPSQALARNFYKSRIGSQKSRTGPP